MPARALFRLFLALVAAAPGGCSFTKVVKDPDDKDKGFRFYKSKPYLMVKPIDGASPNMYSVELQHHADYSEEYSAHIYSGLGTNNTKLTFSPSGTLSETDVSVDSGASAFLTAAATLLGTTPNLLAGRPPAAGGNTKSAKDGVPTPFTVKAYGVPIGLYEAVLSAGVDGRKKLYGWRYVGFLPFDQCPVESAGGVAKSCDDNDLFGLVTIGNAMYFRRLADMKNEPEDKELNAPAPDAPAVVLGECKPVPQAVIPKPMTDPDATRGGQLPPKEKKKEGKKPEGPSNLQSGRTRLDFSSE